MIPSSISIFVLPCAVLALIVCRRHIRIPTAVWLRAVSLLVHNFSLTLDALLVMIMSMIKRLLEMHLSPDV